MPKSKTPPKPKRPRLKPLSTYGLLLEESIKAFLKVNPKKVKARLKKEGLLRVTKKEKVED